MPILSFAKLPVLWLIFWRKINRHVITLVNHDWWILLKQRCNLGWHLAYPVVLDTIVFAQETKRCNSVVCEQEERSHTTAL